MLGIGLPAGALMLCEWWGWEVNLFFAGLLCEGKGDHGCVQLDVFPVVSNTMVVGFMLHYGFSIVSSAHVGNMLGAGEPERARHTSHVTILLAAVISGATMALLCAFRWQWGPLFSTDPAVIELTAEVLPAVALYIFLDSLGPSALVSVLRGLGLVKLPAVINFVSFYVVGIPYGLWLTFGKNGPHLGIVGLWIGLCVAMLTLVSCLLVYLYFVDWQAASQDAQRRSQAEPSDAQEGATSRAPRALDRLSLWRKGFEPVKAGRAKDTELPGLLSLPTVFECQFEQEVPDLDVEAAAVEAGIEDLACPSAALGTLPLTAVAGG